MSKTITKGKQKITMQIHEKMHLSTKGVVAKEKRSLSDHWQKVNPLPFGHPMPIEISSRNKPLVIQTLL